MSERVFIAGASAVTPLVPHGPRRSPLRANGHGPRPAVAISNSFGFGAHNAELCRGGAP